jgi:hypothetical protein
MFQKCIPHPICIEFLFIQHSNNPSLKFGPVLGGQLIDPGIYTHMELTHRFSKIQKNRLWYVTVILTPPPKNKTVNERAME